MRAIDADALIKFIDNRYNITWKDDYEGGIKDACTDILEEINKMPTIEPKRKKGRWIFDEKDFLTKCSECGYHPWIGVIPTIEEATKKLPHCPKCLVEMTEGESMTVKNLITRLLDAPMDAEIMLQTDYDKPMESYSNNVRSVTRGVVFDIDSIEHWASNRILINFTDWREDGEANESD